jgi:hypothetical protein
MQAALSTQSGPAGTEGVVTVEGEAGQTRQRSAKRQSISLPTVKGLAWDMAFSTDSHVSILSLGPRTGNDVHAILDRLNEG